MQLSTILKKGKKYSTRKRVGRGVGSGLGKTSGRGHKGWGQRSGARRRSGYEGGQMPLYRRVPKRGFKNARFRTDYTVINVDQLNGYPAGSSVDLDTVLASGLVSLETRLLKVLGDGDLNRALTVRAQKFSKSALEKITAAGGKAVLLDSFGREIEAE